MVNLVQFVYSRCQQSQNTVQGSVLSHKNTSIVEYLEKVEIQSQGDKVGDLELQTPKALVVFVQTTLLFF